MADYWHLFIGALFLRREAYEYQRDRKDSFAHGLLFIVLIGVLAALASIIGAGVRYASSPNPDAVKNTVLTHLQAMPFYAQSIQPYPEAQRQFFTAYNQVWNNFGSLFMGFPTNAAGWTQLLAGIVTIPLIWIILWFIYGALAHLIASRGTLHVEFPSVLGTLALATAPQAFSVIGILPSAGASSIVIWLWSLVLYIFAIRTAYRTTTAHAIWAALFPLALLLLLLILLSCIGFFVLSSLLRGGGA